MHSNNDIKVLIFSSDHFINSFVELKDHFNFNFDFFEEDKKVNTSLNYKVYIIDEAHMLTIESFNALLKTLEEPPPHVKFIFATTDPYKIPPTIISRCQRYDFLRIPIKKMTDFLEKVVEKENV